MQWDHEIVIVGGGMVGAALAAKLGQAGMSVGLVERASAPTPPSGDYDLRISSLNARSLAFVKASGAVLPGERCCPFRHIDVSNLDGSGHSLFSAHDSGMNDFGIFAVRPLAAPGAASQRHLLHPVCPGEYAGRQHPSAAGAGQRQDPQRPVDGGRRWRTFNPA